MRHEANGEALANHLLGLDPARRVNCAVPGAPGSGKSTLAEALVARLNVADPGTAEVVAMDGFHYDDFYLVPVGLRPRKGAPHLPAGQRRISFLVAPIYHPAGDACITERARSCFFEKTQPERLLGHYLFEIPGFSTRVIDFIGRGSTRCVTG